MCVCVSTLMHTHINIIIFAVCTDIPDSPPPFVSINYCNRLVH